MPQTKSLRAASTRKTDPLAVAVMMYTTGSTAASKAVQLSQYNFLVNACALRRHHQITSDDVIMTMLPIYYANALGFAVLTTLTAGAHLILLRKFDPIKISDHVSMFKPTLINLVPPVLDTILQNRKFNLHDSFRYYVSAAAPLSQQTAFNVWKMQGARIVQGYGLTETTNFSTLMPTSLSNDEYKRLMLDCQIPPVGSEVYGNHVRIFGDNGAACEEEGVGEICMRGHSVMMGYFQNEAETASAFSGDWFHSGDLGYWKRDPSTSKLIITIVGRKKNTIKVNGEALSLEEMERAISLLPNIREVAVAFISYNGNERPVCMIAPMSGVTLSDSLIVTALSKTFSQQKLPIAIKFTVSIPRFPNGKINRRAVSEYFENLGE